MTVATRPPPSKSAAPSPPRPKLGRIAATDTKLAERIVVHAVEGWGKTTLAAYGPNPAILMSRGETGYVTLRKHGLVPDADCVELTTWTDTLEQIQELTDGPSKHGAVVLDALGGFERLCHEFICTRDFNNEWGDKGFSSYMRGYEVSLSEWLRMLSALERLRAIKGCHVVILSHSRIKAFKNPIGPDFDRYIADCHEKTWGVTHKWADSVFFGNYIVVTEEKKKGRIKGVGSDDRVLYTTRRDAYDAKNRYGLSEQIDMPAAPSEMWNTLWNAITNKPKADEQPPL